MQQGQPPRVSIVLPTYNGAKHLAESLDSVIGQSLTDWELIVVDDGSTDSTPTIIEAYCQRDPRIRSVRNNPNRRLPGSLNVGFRLTQGRYLSWTSDDNRYRPAALERMATCLDAHPDVGMVFADEWWFRDDEQGEVHHTRGMETFCEGNHIGACFMYRREVAEAVGDYAEETFLAEDYDYWVRIGLKFKLYHLEEVLYDYRVHDRSLSSSMTEAARQAALAVRDRHLDAMSEHPITRANALLAKMRRALETGDRRTARQALFRLLIKEPLFLRKHRRLALATISGRPIRGCS